MGVIRKSTSLNNCRNGSFDAEIIDDFLENVSEAVNDNLESDENVAATASRRRTDRNRNRRNRLRPEPTFRSLGVRGQSHKKQRRYANANLLSREYETLSDGEELNDISIYDFIPQTVSAFAQLLMDKDNMSAWNDIINCNEDEQWNMLSNSADADGDGDTGREDVDGRAVGAAHSADECFKRIDTDLKNMLKRKHIPLGVLTKIEEEITNFFNKRPVDTYKSCLSSAYQRLLLHACAQYLDLNCQSFDRDGQRWSRVSNPRHFFLQPNMMLAKYLELKNSFARKSDLFL